MAIKASATITFSFMIDVKATYRYYKLQSSTLSTPAVPTAYPPSGWVQAEPTYTNGSTNTLYTVDLTVFTNDTWLYTPVSKSTSYEAAKAAYNKAVNAQDTANSASNKVDNLEDRADNGEFDGEDGYTVLLDNENHTFLGTTDAPIDAEITINVLAYKGTTRMPAKIGTITGNPTGMSVFVDTSVNNTVNAKFKITVSSSMSTNSGILTIPVTVDDIEFIKKFTYSVTLDTAEVKVMKSTIDQFKDQILLAIDNSGKISSINLKDNGKVSTIQLTADNINLTGKDLATFNCKLAAWILSSRYIYQDIKVDNDTMRVQIEAPTSTSDAFLSMRIGNNSNGWSTTYTPWRMGANGIMSFRDSEGKKKVDIGNGSFTMSNVCSLLNIETKFDYTNGTIHITDKDDVNGKFSCYFGGEGAYMTSTSGAAIFGADVNRYYPYFYTAKPLWIKNIITFTGISSTGYYTGLYTSGKRLIWRGWDGNSSYAEMSFFKESSDKYRDVLRDENDGSGYLGTASYEWNTLYTKAVHNSSDRKVKKYIKDIDSESAKTFVLKFLPRWFKMKKQDGSEGIRWKTGGIAQEVNDIILEMGVDWSIVEATRVEEVTEIDEDGNSVKVQTEKPYYGEKTYIDEDGNEVEITDEMLRWTMDYTQMIAPLYKFSQDTYAELQETKEKVTELETKLDQQADLIKTLTDRLDKLEGER